MDHFDDSKLRARVTHDFVSFSTDITDAEGMNEFAEAVTANAVGTLRELLHGFNEASFLARIPPEVLAACFVHLPYGYRLAPTHVCRSWRAAALSAPELWSKIKPWTPYNDPALLQMALSRAGAMPLYLYLDVRPPATPETLYSAIAPFSQQIRHLEWHSEQPDSPWDFPAPNIECFCTSQPITITERFLGGHEGRLRCLYLQRAYLPDRCPVFATVTDLNIVLTPFDEGVPPSTLTNLFALFPRLDWLQILGITVLTAHMLPTGRAPTSLRELSLQSMSWDYDLTPLSAAWDSGNLEHVSLSQYPGIPPDLERMATGAVRLAVRYGNDKSTTRIMFERSASVSHTVSISQFPIARTVSAVTAVQATLTDVHTALISHAALRPLFDLLTALPNLEHLVVHVVTRTADMNVYPNPDAHAFVWAHLVCLADLARGMRRLRAVTLHVWCGPCRRPSFPNADDAQKMLAQLRTLSGSLPPIEVQGFPAEEVASVDLTGLNVRFDFATPGGELRFHTQREPCDPCW